MNAPARCDGARPAPLRLVDLFAARAQYRPGEPVGLIVEVENRSGSELAVRVRAELWRLAERVAGGTEADARVAPGRQRLTVTLEPRGEALAGFGVEVTIAAEGMTELHAAAAFDVAADEHARMRYGFLSDFPFSERGSVADVETLAKLHLNFVQFYDWMYRHHELVSPTERYADPMGKRIDLAVVREKIAACREHGIRAVAYGAVYAATEEFYERHRGWALRHGDGSPYCFIDRFYIMDISRSSPWSRHIVAQYRAAVEKLGFDGIHMDTYGFPKRAFVSAGAARGTRIVELREELPRLIEEARCALGPQRTLIFNNVNAWPMETTAPAPQNAVYIEVWKPFTRYRDLAELIRRARLLGGGKPVILAAYLEPFKEARDEEALGAAEHAALLTTAVITSFGASHLLLGEEGGVLMQGYYSDHALARPAFLARLRRHADFLVRYSELFFDPALLEVTGSHLRVEFPEYAVEGAPVTQSGEGDRVWVLVHESSERKIITFINLTGNPGEEWNAGKAAPAVQHDLRIGARVQRAARRVYTASPDIDGGRPRELAFTYGSDFPPDGREATGGGERSGSAQAEPAGPDDGVPPSGGAANGEELRAGAATGNARADGPVDREILLTTLPLLHLWAILVIDLAAEEQPSS